VSVDGGTPQSAATVAGRAAPVLVAGTLEGAVMIGGTGCSNNGHRWTLAPLASATTHPI
jgi:NaMN:DMB phosphoribosyltransferase